MPYKYRRNCPICGKRDLLYLSDHLRQVHGLSSQARQPWLQRASHLPPLVDLTVEQYPLSLPPSSDVVVPRSPSSVDCLDTQPHPDFAFQHPYSMMVVGPSQCGKTHFVHQLLTHKCMAYPDKKPLQVVWFYNQWQPRYEEIQRALKKKIRFMQGLPELEEDLSSIPTSKHTIIVLDDLMAQATDSPVVSKLFTQGRHRNASVILLLQNMFPKGKYNTDISRNATYKVLFRSPGDRKQIDIMAEQTFAKDRPRFMQAYSQETDRPYGYLVVDNHPRTASEHQVVGDVFGDCYTYPHITSTSSPPSLQSRVESVPLREQQELTKTRKRRAPVVNKSPLKKRKADHRRVPIKNKSKKQTRKQPVHDSSEEESTSEGEEVENTDSKEEEEDPREEGESWNEYWNRRAQEKENSSSGVWHYPKNPHKINLRPPHTGIGFGPRIVYS